MSQTRISIQQLSKYHHHNHHFHHHHYQDLHHRHHYHHHYPETPRDKYTVDRPVVSDCVTAGDPPESGCGKFRLRLELLRVWKEQYYSS